MKRYHIQILEGNLNLKQYLLTATLTEIYIFCYCRLFSHLLLYFEDKIKDRFYGDNYSSQWFILL